MIHRFHFNVFCLLAACTALVVIAGCSDDPKTAATPTKSTCEEIAETCHPVDPGSGAIHDCHEDAEDEKATEASCAAKKTECLTLCKNAKPPTDAGTK